MIRAAGVIVTIPLLFFVPGYLLLKSGLFETPVVPWIEKLLMVVVLSVSASSLLAILLAETGLFKVWVLDMLLIALSLSIRVLFSPRRRPLFVPRPFRWEALVVVALCLLSVLVFFKPAEYVGGDGDPGYYFNVGYELAQEDSLEFVDESAPLMSGAEFENFFRYRDIGEEQGVWTQFYPLFIRSAQSDRVRPFLYHLLPAWVAIFVALFGKMGGFFVVPAFALLAVLAVYALARRFGGMVGAAAAATLFALFYPQVWFSRAPVSEIFCQVFVLASLLFFVRFLDSRGTLVGLAAAISIVSASMARPEALIVAVLMVLVVMARMLGGRWERGDRAIANALLLGLALIWLYARFAVYYYLAVNRGKQTVDVMLIVAALLIALGLVVVNIGALRRFLARTGESLSGKLEWDRKRAARAGSIALSAILLLFFVYYYFVSPRLASLENDPRNFFFYTAGFFGGVAVFVFVGGLCLLIMEADRFTDAFLLVATVAVYLVVFTESGVTSPWLPWLSRRYMTVVIPLLFVGLGYLLARLWGLRRTGARVLVGAASLGFLVAFCIFIGPIFNHVESGGMDEQLKALSARVGSDLVIMPEPSSGEIVGLPLRYQYGVDARRAYRLGSAGIEDSLKRCEGEGRRVLVEVNGLDEVPIEPQVLQDVSMKKAFEVSVSFPRLCKYYTNRPVSTGTELYDLAFYYLEPRD